jgi:hypothetical protein
MSQWLFIVGFFLFWAGVKKRLLRADARENELNELDLERRQARLWDDGDAADTERAYKNKKLEHGKFDLVFESVCWALFAASGLCVAAGFYFWFDEDPSHTWEKALTTSFELLMAGAFGCYFLWLLYRQAKALDKAEGEIRWLTQALINVRRHAEDMRKGSIDNFLELRERLDQLEGRLR